MRLFLFLVVFAVSLSCAQIGMSQSEYGLFAPSAKTMGQGMLFFSGSFEMVSNGKAPTMDGTYVSDGETVQLDKNTPSNDENLFMAFGVLDNLDLGIFLPFHYDGNIRDANVDGFGLGDMMFQAKVSFPVTENLFFGLSGNLFAPTGDESTGFRPRHRWYIDRKDSAFAYTAGEWAVGANGYMSVLMGQHVDFNAYMGLLKVFNSDETFFLWGGGFDIFPKSLLTVILEVSGEAPLRSSHVSRNFLNSPFRLSPALRLHLPNEAFLTISAIIGVNYLRSDDLDNGLPVHLKTDDGVLDYTISGSPTVSVAISLSKKFDLSWRDSDGDGVIDRKDMCPGTGRNQAVNARGCPVDEDQDGVLNIVDFCPGTPVGIVVGRDGCPLDFDHDGVPDYMDKCLGTKAGVAVDSTGCMLDSDGDGVDDNHDRCPSTEPGDPVDPMNGCPLDEDHDGVPNEADMCPGTPENVSIDLMGCPLDFDHDGVPDDLDHCPNSAENEIVDSVGCPLDSDHDGVPDSRDLCPDTKAGHAVNSDGCRVDHDGDGVFDEDDRCPNTPPGAPIDSTGCPVDTDHDGIPDWMDYCPGTLKNVVVDIEGCPMNSRLNFNSMAQRIKFKPGDTTLVNSSYTALSDVIAAMRKYPMALEIQCSAADAPSRAQELSEARALVIYNFLEKKGVFKDRLVHKGYGMHLPPTQTQRGGSSAHVRLVPILVKND